MHLDSNHISYRQAETVGVGTAVRIELCEQLFKKYINLRAEVFEFPLIFLLRNPGHIPRVKIVVSDLGNDHVVIAVTVLVAALTALHPTGLADEAVSGESQRTSVCLATTDAILLITTIRMIAVI